MEINLSFHEEKSDIHGEVKLGFTVRIETLLKLITAARESNFVQVAAEILTKESKPEEQAE